MTNATTGLSILITDDDEHNRANLTYYLSKYLNAATIEQAADGETAIQMVTAHMKNSGKSYDLIFMDYKMPGLNGDQTTTAIRGVETSATKKPKSIIITWSSAKTMPYRDADDVMQKPAREQDVISILETHGFMTN